MASIKKRAQKAYENHDFLNSPPARIIRLLAEYIEPRARLREESIRDTIVFFGSARIPSREEAGAKRLQVEHTDAVITRTRSASEEVIKELTKTRTMAETKQRLSAYYEDAVELARLITEWSVHVAARDYERMAKKSKSVERRLPFVSAESVKTHSFDQRYVICSGGGPGIMEAANKGAALAGGRSIGFNIYITDELNFEFHYFFMRKFWFAYLGKALVVFPGGFGTCDELFELLTLVQTGKIKKKMPIVVYGSDFWKKLINWEQFIQLGLIDPEDLNLLHFSDSPQEAFEFLRTELERLDEGEETFMLSGSTP
jgi:uncharacterized protein (TIGR00730 family)